MVKNDRPGDTAGATDSRGQILAIMVGYEGNAQLITVPFDLNGATISIR